MGRPTAVLTHGKGASGACLCLGILAARKRIGEFLDVDLVYYLVFLQLVLDVLLYFLFVSPYRINIVFSCPKMPVSVLVFQIRMPVEYHQAVLPFEMPHGLCCTVFQRDTPQHMNVVWTRLCFYDFHALLFAQLSKYCKKYSILNMVVPHHGGNVGKSPLSTLYL